MKHFLLVELQNFNKMIMNSKEKQEFEKILQEAEDPKNIGQGSWACPENPTPSEKTKYNICQKILRYQRENNLSDKIIAHKTHLTLNEVEDILFCRISKFSLDNLLNYASRLFSPAEIKVVIEPKKDTPHAPAV